MPQYEAPDGRIIETDTELDASGLAKAFQADMHSRIAEAAKQQSVPAPLALAIAQTESGMRHTDERGQLLTNPKSSARGIFQLTDAARKDMGLTSDDLNTNIDAGVRYLKAKYDEVGGDWDKAIAAYKQGAAGLAAQGPTPETQGYLAKVQHYAKQMGLGTGLEIGTSALGGIAGMGGGPLGVGLGAGTGYIYGKRLAQLSGLEEEKGPAELALSGAQVGAGVGGGAAAGPLGFATADTLANLLKDEIQTRFQTGVLDPSETKVMGKQPFAVPGGRLLERFSMDALLDMGARLGIKGLEAYSGLGAVKRQIGEAERNAAEEGQKIQSAVGRTQVGEEFAQQKLAQRGEAALEAAKRETQVKEGPPTAQAAMQRLIGKTPEELNAARIIDPAEGGVPSQAAANARTRINESVFAPQRRIQDALGDEYEKLLAPHSENLAETSGLRNAVQDRITGLMEGRMTEAGHVRLYDQISPETKQLLNDYQAISGGEGTSIQDLMRLRSRASKLMATGKTQLDKSVGFGLVDDALDALNASGFETQKLRALNARYAAYMTEFRGVNKAIAQSDDPSAWGRKLFLRPRTAIATWDAADSQEKASLREALGTYLYGRPNLRNALNDVGEDTLKRYFGNTPYAKAEVWLTTEPKVVKFDTLLAENPEARQTFDDALSRRIAKITADRNKETIGTVLKLAKKLGPTGRAVEQEIFRAPSEQKSEIAQRFLDTIDPEALQTSFRQGGPGMTATAVQALSKLSRKDYAHVLWGKAKLAAGTAAIEMLARGHIGPWTLAMGATSAALLPGALLKNAWVNSLRNPRIARYMIEAINSGSFDQMANAVADSAVAVEEAKRGLQ